MTGRVGKPESPVESELRLQMYDCNVRDTFKLKLRHMSRARPSGMTDTFSGHSTCALLLAAMQRFEVLAKKFSQGSHSTLQASQVNVLCFLWSALLRSCALTM